MMPSSMTHSGDHSGWIYKQGSLVKSWKRRFMVLRGKQLTYYDTAKITSNVKEKGSFQVITVELSNEIQNGLIVHGRNGRVLKLYTDNAEATSAWYNAIMEATTGAGGGDRISVCVNERYSTLSGTNNSDVVDVDEEIELMDRLDSVMDMDDSQISHTGWLMKEGAMVKTWKKRFFQLRGNTLSYFESPGNGMAAKGSGEIARVEVDAQKPCSLAITFENDRVLRVTAESQNEMEEWLCKISDAIEYANLAAGVRPSMALRQSPAARMSMSRNSGVSRRASTPMRHSLAGRPTLSMDKHPTSSERTRSISSVSASSSSLSHSYSMPDEQSQGQDEVSDVESEGDWI